MQHTYKLGYAYTFSLLFYQARGVKLKIWVWLNLKGAIYTASKFFIIVNYEV